MIITLIIICYIIGLLLTYISSFMFFGKPKYLTDYLFIIFWFISIIYLIFIVIYATCFIKDEKKEDDNQGREI